MPAANDFVNATIIDVETLDFVSGNSTATFAGDQFDSGEIATVSGSDGVDQLIVTTDDQLTDIGGVTFTGWTNGTDTITILGSAAGDILAGSAQADTIDGGGDADFMHGEAGNDTYIVDDLQRLDQRGRRRRHRPGAELCHLHAVRLQYREPDADRHRRHQRHRQRARQHHHRQLRR